MVNAPKDDSLNLMPNTQNTDVYQHQYFASISISLIEIESQLLVTQDLLKNLLIQQGASRETLNAECLTALNLYRETLTSKFAESLADYKETLINALNSQSIDKA